jgi:hypothetical protein
MKSTENKNESIKKDIGRFVDDAIGETRSHYHHHYYYYYMIVSHGNSSKGIRSHFPL